MESDKLESILTTANKMFARYGLKKTSIDDIARKARVAKGTIYNYFGSKDEVYLGVLRREAKEIVKNIRTEVDQAKSPQDKLIVFGHAKLRHMREAINLLNLEKEGMEKFLPEAKAIREEYLEQEVEVIESILKEGLRKGVFQIRNVALTAKAICYALLGFELNWLIHESGEKVDDHLNQLADILFYGIMTRKPVEAGQKK